MIADAAGTKKRRWVLAGLAVAVPLAAVAFYFALFAPAPAPSSARPAISGSPAAPAVAASSLPPDHPPIEGAAPQTAQPHPPVGSTGRTGIEGHGISHLNVDAVNMMSMPRHVSAVNIRG